MQLYPLKFRTIFKDKIWGGEKINSILGKDFSPLPNCGESWELSGVKENVSIVKEGALMDRSLTELIAKYRETLVGQKVYKKFGNDFPLLVKFIDANDDSSIQVHPNDELALQRHNCLGKTEMWYILQSNVGAGLTNGFTHALTRQEYDKHRKAGELTQILNEVPVEAHDVFFIPAGTVHAIGKGSLFVEIQQSSDVTYRIHDFDRLDSSGNKRELHTELALDAIDFSLPDQIKTSYDRKVNKTVCVVDCPYFTANRLYYNSAVKLNYHDLDSFVILICLEGSVALDYGTSMILDKGEVILLPACIKQISIRPLEEKFKLLESFIQMDNKIY